MQIFSNFKRILTFFLLLIVCFSVLRLNPPSQVFSQDPSPQIIESDDPSVTRTGTWTAQTSASASGGSYLYSSGSPDDVLTLEFQGSSIEIVYVSGTALGTLAIEVDGTVLRTVITKDTETRFSQRTVINYLTDESHTLRIYGQEGSIIGTDAFVSDLPNKSQESSDFSYANTSSRDVEVPGAPLFDVHRVNVSTNGEEANGLNGGSSGPAISYDGRYVAFVSQANNLDSIQDDTLICVDYPNIQASCRDVFVRDRLNRETVRITVSSSGVEANNDSASVDISANGRYVVFSSLASNLVANDNNSCMDIFLYDRTLAQTMLVSHQAGSQASASGCSNSPKISGDGRFVVYESLATNIVVGDTNGVPDTFLWDRTIEQNLRISVRPGGIQTTGGSREPDISLDGAYIVFTSIDSNLVSGDTNGSEDVFLYNRLSQAIERVSLNSAEGQAAGVSSSPSISDLGNFIAFASDAPNLVANDNNFAQDIFVRNRSIGETNLVSGPGVNSPIGNFHSFSPAISGDGRYVVFVSISDNLVAGDTNNVNDVFVKDTMTGQIARASVNEQGVQGNGDSNAPKISGNGSYVTFASNASNMVPLDGNGLEDIFVTLNPRRSDALLIFRPSSNGLSLIMSLQDLPPSSDYYTYTADPPTAALNGQWVAGDWDGDGVKTPGVYATNGVFYHTNDYGPDTNWTGTWFGLFGRTPVVGRYSASSVNDCIGVVDSSIDPTYGPVFALYFTCSTDGGNPPKNFQWLSTALPDSDGFSGTRQFVAGDFNGDTVDSIAVRRGPFIAFTDVAPSVGHAAFNRAQYIGTPSNSDYGTLVAGDWNADNLDSFGLFYQDSNGSFYRRNDLDWNSGVYILQRIGQPVGSPVLAGGWH